MDCPTLPELTLSDWTDEVFLPLNGRRYPLSGTLELTDRCNYNCIHCYINQPAGSQSARQSELSTAFAKDILDQVSDAGCLFMLLTGGEIFLRPDFAEIYLHAKQRGLLLNLFTNGSLITTAQADLLADYPPRAVEITMYGATRETYEAVTRVPGSYDRFRKTVDQLVARGLTVILKTVLMTVNYHEFSAMRSFAESLGLMFRYDGILWPRLDGSLGPAQYQVPLEELAAFDFNDPGRRDAWEAASRTLGGKLLRDKYVYSCGAGIRSFHIDSQGRMTICAMSRRYGYDLKTMRFAEAWERIAELRKIERKLTTPCQTCTIGALCTQCPGWSQGVHGDDETPVDFICQLAHLRAMQLAPIEV